MTQLQIPLGILNSQVAPPPQVPPASQTGIQDLEHQAQKILDSFATGQSRMLYRSRSYDYGNLRREFVSDDSGNPQPLLVFEVPMRIDHVRLRDQKTYREFRENWPKIKRQMEELLDSKLPKNLAIEFIEVGPEDNRISHEYYVCNYDSEFCISPQDLKMENRGVLAYKILATHFGKPGQHPYSLVENPDWNSKDGDWLYSHLLTELKYPSLSRPSSGISSFYRDPAMSFKYPIEQNLNFYAKFSPVLSFNKKDGAMHKSLGLNLDIGMAWMWGQSGYFGGVKTAYALRSLGTSPTNQNAALNVSHGLRLGLGGKFVGQCLIHDIDIAAVTLFQNPKVSSHAVQDVVAELNYSFNPVQDILGIGIILGKSMLHRSGYLGLNFSVGIDMIHTYRRRPESMRKNLVSECRPRKFKWF